MSSISAEGERRPTLQLSWVRPGRAEKSQSVSSLCSLRPGISAKGTMLGVRFFNSFRRPTLPLSFPELSPLALSAALLAILSAALSPIHGSHPWPAGHFAAEASPFLSLFASSLVHPHCTTNQHTAQEKQDDHLHLQPQHLPRQSGLRRACCSLSLPRRALADVMMPEDRREEDQVFAMEWCRA